MRWQWGKSGELPEIGEMRGAELSSCGAANVMESSFAINREFAMYIIAIAWLYVVIMISIVSDSILKGVVRFLFLGALPMALLFWLNFRRREPNDSSAVVNEDSEQGNRNEEEKAG
jgi:hypothetical protein